MRKRLAPATNEESLVDSSRFAVRIITGIDLVFSLELSCRQTSSPFMCGSIRSRIMTSGDSCSAFNKPSSPSREEIATNPASVKIADIMSFVSLSSSMMRIRVGLVSIILLAANFNIILLYCKIKVADVNNGQGEYVARQRGI